MTNRIAKIPEILLEQENRHRQCEIRFSVATRCTQKKITGSAAEGTQRMVVISCGLGIQTVADLTGKPVIAASNT